MIKYVWRCGKRIAYIEMAEPDMVRINEDKFGKESLMDLVNRELGFTGDHKHNFVTNEFDNLEVVLHDCPGR